MASSEELARRAAATREQLSRTLDELRLRASPRQLVDDVAGYLRQTGERFTPTTTAPPGRSRYMLPLALIGAGLTWLALEARRSEHRIAQQPVDGQPAVLPVGETEVIATPVSPTLAPDQGATLRPLDAGSIAPGDADPLDSGQRPLPL
jgi:hypothetical protein